MKSYFLRQINIILIIASIISLNGCGIYKYTDSREVSPNPDERVKKNIEEGKGLRLATLGEKNGNFQFASSNPLWRASLDVIDFAPLLTANYSGGIIITDWFNGGAEDNKRNLKITIKFLSNEIRSDSVKVDVHERICSTQNNCSTNLVKSKIANEIKVAILKKAAFIQKNTIEENVSKNKKKRVLLGMI